MARSARDDRGRPISNVRALALATVGSGLAAAFALGLNGTGNLGWHAAVRITAVVCFPLWWLAFVSGPLARLAPHRWTRALRTQRRPLGVAFAASLVVHGATIVALSQSEPSVIDPGLEFGFGGMGIVFAIAMAVTSTDAAMRRFGSRWRVLHRTGQWWLFVIFASSYGGRVTEDLDYWPGAAMVVAALALRVAAHARNRRADPRPTPA